MSNDARALSLAVAKQNLSNAVVGFRRYCGGDIVVLNLLRRHSHAMLAAVKAWEDDQAHAGDCGARN